MNGCEAPHSAEGRSRFEMRQRRQDVRMLEDEPLWSGKLCPDHPQFSGREMPPRDSRDCKNCWRLLMGYPTRMYTDRFPASATEKAA